MHDLGRLRDLGGVPLLSRCLSFLACTPGSLTQPPGKKAKGAYETVQRPSLARVLFSSRRLGRPRHDAVLPIGQPDGHRSSRRGVADARQRSRRARWVQTDWGRRLPEFKANELAAPPDLDSPPRAALRKEWSLPAVPGRGTLCFQQLRASVPGPRCFHPGARGHPAPPSRLPERRPPDLAVMWPLPSFSA